MTNDPTRKLSAFDPEKVANVREHRLFRLRNVKTHLAVLTTPGTAEQEDLSPRVRFYLRLARWFVDQVFAALSELPSTKPKEPPP